MKKGAESLRPRKSQALLLRCFRLAVAGGDGSADLSEHLLGSVRVLAGRLQFQILIEGIGCPFGSYHLIVLHGGLADQVDALPVVRIRTLGIECNGLVECGNGVVDLAGVGQDRAFVVVVGSSDFAYASASWLIYGPEVGFRASAFWYDSTASEYFLAPR
jgi:hypothetical protein